MGGGGERDNLNLQLGVPVRDEGIRLAVSPFAVYSGHGYGGHWGGNRDTAVVVRFDRRGDRCQTDSSKCRRLLASEIVYCK